MTTPASIMLRQLFPSWAFFDVARLAPALQFRVLPPDAVAGEWMEVIRPSPRRWWNLILNPAGTQTLAAQTLVERWYTELVELGEEAPTCRETFGLVRALAENALIGGAQEATTTRPSDWQLRLVVVDDESGHVDLVYESGRFLMTDTVSTGPVSS